MNNDDDTCQVCDWFRAEDVDGICPSDSVRRIVVTRHEHNGYTCLGQPPNSESEFALERRSWVTALVRITSKDD